MCGSTPAPYQVGSYYEIKCVHGALYDDIQWWPVMGEAHRDKEIIGFPDLHYHIDWRFVSARTYHRHVASDFYRSESKAAFGVPLMLMPEKRDGYFRRPRQFGDVPGEIETRRRRLKCKRSLPPYPHGAAPWMARLSEHHAAACLKHRVCPHRGYDLSREPVVDGVVTCPLHGLRWNVETGACVQPSPPQTPPTFAAFAAAGA